MQVDAIYDQGRLEFQTPVNLRQQRIHVRVEIPDQEIADAVRPSLSTYDLSEFPVEVREEVARLSAVRQEALRQSLPQNKEETAEESQRWAALEFRNVSSHDS